MTESPAPPPRPKSKLVSSEPAPAKKPPPKKVPQRNGRAKMAREIMARFR